jgi:hypothetical protein
MGTPVHKPEINGLRLSDFKGTGYIAEVWSRESSEGDKHLRKLLDGNIPIYSHAGKEYFGSSAE